MTNINNLKYCDVLVKALLNGLHEVEIISYLNSNARELCMLNNY